MERELMNALVKWKDSSSRKPLIIRGARQTGKTWLMKEFGKRFYKRTAYINLENSIRLTPLFENGFDIPKIVIALQLESGVEINAVDTLIILDEIQSVPLALSSLKYFCENYPQYHIVAAGSLLGIAHHSGVSFPVGKVEFIDMFPMSFIEFLTANGKENLVSVIEKGDTELLTVFKVDFIEQLRRYYFVGGMPEAVLSFSKFADYHKVRTIQKSILNAYEMDFSKHAPVSIIPRIRMVWNSIPSQLSKENRKFIFGLLKEGSRARDYELAISWLVDCGQAYKIYNVRKPGMPLKAYEDLSSFKLYLVDVGLLTAMGDIDKETLLNGNSIFTEFKGALTEQFVLQQLMNTGNPVFYWSADKSSAEVDFILQFKNSVFPLEVKAEENLRSKSLKVYYEKYSPSVSLRTSMSDYRRQDWITNIPLYAINNIHGFLSDNINENSR